MSTQQVDIELLKLFDKKIIDVYVGYLQLKQRLEELETGITTKTDTPRTKLFDTKFINTLNVSMSHIIDDYKHYPDLLKIHDERIEFYKESLKEKETLLNQLRPKEKPYAHLRVLRNDFKK